ncbi:hypothetical protein LEN26_016239 [Aphanomyces euteiches]|nr:hypothetical protein LEN26_016239 [Aphanomyces euteiches]KAH9115808.1 hypothetical protein AeMF1_010187 [Aphanomyces euteiches]KAH9194082.1 hypothetical protein AeNC1_003933 [Aphanomyces euteiches]
MTLLGLGMSIEYAGACVIQLLSVYAVYASLYDANPSALSSINVVSLASLFSSSGFLASTIAFPIFYLLDRMFHLYKRPGGALSGGIAVQALGWLMLALINEISVMFFVRVLTMGVSGLLATSVAAVREDMDVRFLLQPHWGRLLGALIVCGWTIVKLHTTQDFFWSMYGGVMVSMAALAVVVSMLLFCLFGHQDAYKRCNVDDDDAVTIKMSDVDGLPPHLKAMKKRCPQYVLGATKVGNPFWLFHGGQIPWSDLRDQDAASIQTHLVDIIEWIQDRSGRPIVGLVDLEGLGLSDMQGSAIEWTCALIRRLQQQCPNQLHRLYIVNVPFWFSWVWKTVRQQIDAATLEKIVFVKSNGQSCPTLLENIGARVLPTHYGGDNDTPYGTSPEEIQLHLHLASIRKNDKLEQDLSDDDTFFECTLIDDAGKVAIQDGDQQRSATTTTKWMRLYFALSVVHVGFDELFPLFVLYHPALASFSPLHRLGMASCTVATVLLLHSIIFIRQKRAWWAFFIQMTVFLAFPALFFLQKLSVLSASAVVLTLWMKAQSETWITSTLWQFVDKMADTPEQRRAFSRTVAWTSLLANGFGRLLFPMLYVVVRLVWLPSEPVALGLVYSFGAAFLLVIYGHFRSTRRSVESQTDLNI